MRNEALTGYLLHQRPYQEKRALYYLFSQEHGIISGIGKKGAPLFELLQLFATGKRELKTFSQITIATTELHSKVVQTSRYQKIGGQNQYAALYLNEILWRLLPQEDAAPDLWRHYEDSLNILKQPLTDTELRLCLRRFEQQLFIQLGFVIAFTQDSLGNSIMADSIYRFAPDAGFLAVNQQPNEQANAIANAFTGSEIQAMADLGISEVTLTGFSRLYRHLIDHLLDHKPLQSRKLWQQQLRYQQ